MIRVYLLEVTLLNHSELLPAADLIHDALLLSTADPAIRLLIMDTTPAEHDALVAVAVDTYPPEPEDIDLYNSQVEIIPPDPDTLRAEELLSSSPDAITQPAQWELLRIIGRRLGYRFD